MDLQIYKKITAKKEFSQLPKKDVELMWKKFEKHQVSDEEKVRLTRDLLRKIFSVFTSNKLLGLKNKDRDFKWFLQKHISTKERLSSYEELYMRILNIYSKEKLTIFDLGAGINGFSYSYLAKINPKVEYIGIEPVGQLTDLMNYYFKTKGLQAWALQESVFNLNKIKKYLKQTSGKKVVFLFKLIDSLEMVEKNYSKKLLKEIVPLADRVVVSFATRSLMAKKKFKVKRYWIESFIKENFNIVDDFELNCERYIVFEKRK